MCSHCAAGTSPLAAGPSRSPSRLVAGSPVVADESLLLSVWSKVTDLLRVCARNKEGVGSDPLQKGGFGLGPGCVRKTQSRDRVRRDSVKGLCGGGWDEMGRDD